MEILEGKVLLWLESARFVKSKPGVYVLYDKKLNALYIGESDNLQKEFEKYVDTNFEALRRLIVFRNKLDDDAQTMNREFTN